MADKSTAEGKQLVDLGGGVFAEKVVAVTTTGADIAGGGGGGGGDASAANQTALNTLVGAVTEAAPASDTASSGLNGRLQRIAQRLTSLIALLPASLGTKTAANSLAVTLASDGTFATTLGEVQASPTANTVLDRLKALLTAFTATKGYASSASVTRTNDTNVYAANDVVGVATGSTAALTFANIGPGAGEIIITSVSFEKDHTAIISGETSYLLHLYSVTPPSALGDNVAFDLPSGDRASYLGSINLGTPADLGSTLYVATDGVNKQLTLASSSLFGYLVTVGGYTPVASIVHTIKLHSVAV